MGKIFWAIIISVFIIIGIIIANSNNLDLKDTEDQKELASLYTKFVYNKFVNIKSIVGSVIDQGSNIEPPQNETEDSDE